jgi:hypothetical protein
MVWAPARIRNAVCAAGIRYPSLLLARVVGDPHAGADDGVARRLVTAYRRTRLEMGLTRRVLMACRPALMPFLADIVLSGLYRLTDPHSDTRVHMYNQCSGLARSLDFREIRLCVAQYYRPVPIHTSFIHVAATAVRNGVQGHRILDPLEKHIDIFV